MGEFTLRRTRRNVRLISRSFPAQAILTRKVLSSIPLRNILITAVMSAGKSTLINAITGSEICQTQNGACTSKIHFISNESYEYASGISAGESDEDAESLHVCFRSNLSDNYRYCLIDTPGVNSSTHPEHKKLTYKAIEQLKYDFVIYVINGSYIGVDDDIAHIQYISKHVPSNKILFVVNKLDNYRPESDSIPNAIEEIKSMLVSMGIKKPKIFPMSAYSALLAKKYIFHENMPRREIRELEAMIANFIGDDVNLSLFGYPLRPPSTSHHIINHEELDIDAECYMLLEYSGLMNLEDYLGSANISPISQHCSESDPLNLREFFWGK